MHNPGVFPDRCLVPENAAVLFRQKIILGQNGPQIFPPVPP